MDDDDSVASERRLSRTLTQRYDMHALRSLQELEVTNDNIRYSSTAFLSYRNCDQTCLVTHQLLYSQHSYIYNSFRIISHTFMRILQVVLRDELMQLCQCSEDDLPVELDLLLVYNANEVDRKAILVSRKKRSSSA